PAGPHLSLHDALPICVLVRLEQVSPQPEGLAGTSLWVPAGQVEAPGGFTLRSHLCAIPAGQERDYALRTLILPVSRYVRDYCLRIELWAGLPRFVELSFAIHVPLEQATEYLWDLRSEERRVGKECR